MPDFLVQGIAIGFSAGIAPGPLLAIYLTHATTIGWRKTLPAALAPLISDGPIILIALLFLSQIPAWLLLALRIIGGVFLIYIAIRIFNLRNPIEDGSDPSSDLSKPLRTAVAVNLVNPNPYIFWGVVIGPILVSEWRNNPASALYFAGGFYATMILVFACLIIFFGKASERVNLPYRTISILSSLGMAGFGLYQLGMGIGSLSG